MSGTALEAGGAEGKRCCDEGEEAAAGASEATSAEELETVQAAAGTEATWSGQQQEGGQARASAAVAVAVVGGEWIAAAALEAFRREGHGSSGPAALFVVTACSRAAREPPESPCGCSWLRCG